MPWALPVIPGSMIEKKLLAYIIQIISQVNPVEASAYEIAPKKLQSMSDMIDDFIVLLPPQFFKLGKLAEMDVAKKVTKIVISNWPVNVMADDCPTNSCTLNKISENLGLLFPSIRCVSHPADGTIKQMVNLRSMNIPEISDFLPPF